MKLPRANGTVRFPYVSGLNLVGSGVRNETLIFFWDQVSHFVNYHKHIFVCNAQNTVVHCIKHAVRNIILMVTQGLHYFRWLGISHECGGL